MKKLFVLFFAVIILSLLIVGVSAAEFITGEYYLEADINMVELFFVYSSQEDFNADYQDDNMLNNYICILCTPEFQEYLDEIYQNYKDLPVLDEETGYNGYDSFTEYFNQYNSSLLGNTRLQQDLSQYVEYIENRESESGGNGSGGTGGGIEGDDGSSSSGSQNGTPNVTINPEVDTSKWDKCFCELSGGDLQCDCYCTGFGDGWTAALESDAVKQALQEAFDQGFREVNTDSWHDTVANEKEQAVNQYKESEEHQALIESEKEKAIQEYKESEKYVEELTEGSSSLTDKQKEAKDKIGENAVEDFKNSPEQLEIIGQAEKDAVADFVVEMESIFGGEGVPSEGPAAEYGSKIEEMIDGAKQDAVNEFSSSIQSALGGSGVPGTGGTPGEGVPGEDTPEGELLEAIQNNISVAYNNGVTQGVSDFKVGLEYKTSLKTEYNAGSEAGYSKGYSAGTNDGYADGLIDGAEAANVKLYEQGKEDFKNGEYAQVISDTYIKGYEDGAANVESVNPAVIVAPLAILAVLIVVLTVISKKTKRKR